MKQIIFAFLMLISNLLIAQNTFIYQLTPKNKAEKEIQSGPAADFFKATSDPIEYVYKMNNNRAVFYPLLKIDNSQTNQIDLLQLSAKTLGEYFYDYKNKLIENKVELSGKEYIVTSNFNDLHWIDTNDTEVINGYQTKKYITKRKEKGLTKDKIFTTTIWIDESYSQDIAPFGLMGLKGLVVKVNFNGFNNLILDKIEETKLKEIQPLKAKNRLTKEEYQKLIDERMETIRNKRQERLNFKD